MKNIKKVFLLFLLVILFNVGSVKAMDATFYKCVDGDTADFKINGEVKKARFLAIDTPETKHPTKGEEPFGKEASNYTCDALKKAKKITLEYDDGSDKTDKYDRLLVWVFVDDELLQEKLVKEGLAKVAYLYGDYKYTGKLQKVESEAKKNNVGIWGDYKEDYSEYIWLAIVVIVVLIICIFDKSFRKSTSKKIKNKAKREFNKEINKLLK